MADQGPTLKTYSVGKMGRLTGYDDPGDQQGIDK
jgi:hypothetical protein